MSVEKMCADFHGQTVHNKPSFDKLCLVSTTYSMGKADDWETCTAYMDGTKCNSCTAFGRFTGITKNCPAGGEHGTYVFDCSNVKPKYDHMNISACQNKLVYWYLDTRKTSDANDVFHAIIVGFWLFFVGAALVLKFALCLQRRCGEGKHQRLATIHMGNDADVAVSAVEMA